MDLADPAGPAGSNPVADARLDQLPLIRAAGRFAAAWRVREAGLLGVQLPERRIDAIYRESVTEILGSRYDSPNGWVQAVNKFQYQAFWLRDSAIMDVALDQAGLHRIAAQNLGFLPQWQQADGEYISRSGEQDGAWRAGMRRRGSAHVNCHRGRRRPVRRRRRPDVSETTLREVAPLPPIQPGSRRTRPPPMLSSHQQQL